MTEAKFSMSKTALLRECSYWVGKDCGERLSSGSADHGTLVHDAIDKAIYDGSVSKDYEREVEGALRYIDTIRNLDSAYSICSEVKYDLNCSDWTVRSERSSKRDYEYLPGHVYGTADVEIIVDRTLHIVDWKTGRGTGAHDQLRALGGAAALYHDGSVDRVVLHAVHVGPDKCYPIGVWTYTPLALRETLVEIAWSLQTPGQPKAGSHCSDLYCPYADRCKALNGSLPVDLQEPVEAPRSAQDVSRLVPALLNKKKRIEAVLEACKGIARDEEVVLDGKVWKETFQNRQSVDKDGLVALARRLGATDADFEPLVKTSRSSGGFKWTNKKGGE